MTLDEIMSRIEDNDMDVTLTGGDPLRDPVLVMPLMQAIKETLTVGIYRLHLRATA